MKPKAPVRRYDVFAAWNYLEGLDEGGNEAKAKQYGVWMATVIAAHKFRRRAEQRGTAKSLPPKEGRTAFQGLTAEDYEERIRRRMGAGFHDQVFLPTLRKLRNEGRNYLEIRDEVRADWKPAESA